ncbi:MAG: hypothetical protein L3J33_11175 [Rhodobacteraceae bacterium]|nr:hypothetical protein [Paracoccaceae bacterium]
MAKEKLSLVEWLGYSKSPDLSKSQTLGGILGGLLFFVVAGSVLTVFTLFVMALFNGSDSGDARNYALILAALLGVPFIIWRAFVTQKQVNIAEQGHMTDRISKAVGKWGRRNPPAKMTTKPNLILRSALARFTRWNASAKTANVIISR